jgi:APA family basic amino acid/polyamine antiporter
MAVTKPAAPGAPNTARALYSRRSTGLVRELSTFDAFALCSGAIAIPIGAAQAFLWAPALFPGVDMRWSFVVAAAMALFFGLVYIYLTQMMPRSGGDYVWVSRILHPSVGFAVSAVLTFVPLSWTALNTGVMPTMFLPGLADLTGHHGFELTQGQQMLIGTGITLAIGLLVMIGMRFAARLATVLFGIVAAGTLLWIALMLLRSHGGFVAAFDADSPMKYRDVIATAEAKGFDPSPDLGSTLLGVIYGFQFFVGFQWVAYFAGEVRGVQRVAKRAILGVWGTTAVVYVVAAVAMYHVFGFRFLSSAVYLFSDQPEAYKATAAPYISSLSQYLTGSPVLQWAIPITFLCSIPWITISCFLVGTRNILAWSFDRILPERLSSVSDRFHTPVWATVFAIGIIEVILWATVYTDFWAWLVNWIAVMALAFFVVCVCAVVLPFRRRDLFERAPESVRGRWLGLPKLVVVGVLGAAAEAVLIGIAFSTPEVGGEVTMSSLIYAFAIPVVAFALYWVSRGVRRSQGIELDRTFAEIPPE